MLCENVVGGVVTCQPVSQSFPLARLYEKRDERMFGLNRFFQRRLFT
ncbi:hypothetical protein [Pseudomonas sp. FG-3G]|nr:hypothetical protein [Pseudomonas sp. FG-3G]